MKNTKSTKRALLSAILALVMTVSMLVGTTFAWFTDSVTSSGNKIVAGELDVELHMFNAASGAYEDISSATKPIFGADGLVDTQEDVSTIWEPGKTQVVYLAIKNAGDLALKYRVVLDVTEITKNLDDVVTYTITPDAKAGDVTAWDGANANSIVAGEQVVSASNVALEADAIHYFALSVHMDELAGNEYMNGSITFDLSVLAAQLAYENDSFGNSFDGGAGYQPNTSNPAVLPDDPSDAEDIIVESSSGMTVTVSPEVYENMDDTTESFTLSHGDIVVDSANGTVTVKKADLLDQNSEVIDLTGNTEPIPVTIPVGNAFADGESVLVYHDGVLVDDAVVVNGVISYDAYHFCDIVIARPGEFVAYVGSALYKSLPAAVAAAKDGETVVMVQDVTEQDGITIENKAINIDLNGKSFTVTEGASTNNRNLLIKGSSVVTVKNGTMIAAGNYSSGTYGTVRVEESANVTLDGLKLYNYRGNGLNIKATGGTVAVKNTEIYAQYGGGIEAAGATVTIDNVLVEQKGMYTAPYNSMCVSVNGGGKAIINSGTFSTECITAEEANNQGTSHGPWVVGVLNSGGELIINGGVYSNDNFGDNALATAARGMILADTGAKVTVNGGEFNGLAKIVDIQNNLGIAAKNPVVTLLGGKFSSDPTSPVSYGGDCIVLPRGYAVLEEDGAYVVRDISVAEMGGLKYTSLQAAIDEAADGDTIVVIKDVVLAQNFRDELFNGTQYASHDVYCGLVIPDGKKVTLDLNGKTVYYESTVGNATNVAIFNIGDLTIMDSKEGGKISYKAIAGTSSYTYFKSTIFNIGNLTVNSGTVENICETSTDVTGAIENNGNIAYSYKKDCTVTINGGTITGSHYYAIRLYTHYNEGYMNRVTVNDGIINNGIYAQHGESWYYADPASKRLNVDMQVVVNGGTFNIDENDVIPSIRMYLNNPDNNAAKLEINGGEFFGGVRLQVQRGTYYLNGSYGDRAPAEDSGTRNAEWLAKVGGVIHGGIFHDIGEAGNVLNDISTMTSGVLVDNGDGTYSVEPIFVEVATVEELMAALKDGEFIRITESISGATIKLPASLTKVFITAAEGVVIENSTIMASDGSYIYYDGLTFDGITFVNSRISLTGWRTNGATIKNLTVNNCVFKDLDDTTNSAPVHINMDATEAVENFTFTNNVIDGATGGSKSGVYAQVTGKVMFANNIINNVSFRPYVIQITTDDGINDEFVVTGNVFSGSASGRAQGLGNNAEGTDKVKLVVSGNIFKGITSAQQICYWNFNSATTSADLSKNYYDIDITADPSRIYYNNAAASVADLVAFGVYPFYTELNADGTINVDSLVVAP